MGTKVPDKRWTQIFKALANVNRVKIVKLLAAREKLSVTAITEKLDISFNATSRHLLILYAMGIVESKGTDNHVFYWLHPDMPADIRAIVRFVIDN